MNIKPKGAKVLVEVVEKRNEDNKTKGGIILAAREKDSHDNALLYGTVIALGTSEIDLQGHERAPDVELGTKVLFNRYESYLAIAKGMTDYYLVDCRHIWGCGELYETEAA